ncbi:M20/M25/M40 family metallo-hydrolase [Actinocorallia lasiicapitis]
MDELVVDICRDLIRIDTSNFGDHSGPGERKAAEYVAEKLEDVGIKTTVLESHAKRTSVVARIEGEDPSRDALLLHGHLDVVPAQAGDWTHDPFGGEIADGCVWGRGAVDMKDMDAMILASVIDRAKTGRKPKRDLVLAFLADEEAGGKFGAHWLVDNHPGLFEGCTEAVGEVGGFSLTVPGDRRLYLIETAEKGLAWMRLKAVGTAGHGSMVHSDNAVSELARAVTRLGDHRFPIRLTKTVRRFLEQVCEAYGVEFDPNDPEACLPHLGTLSRMIGATLRHTLNPTRLDAGYKVNVIPQEATAQVDGRFLPGLEKDFFDQVDALLGDKVTREFVHYDIAVETDFEGGIVDAMEEALTWADPGAIPVPYCLSAGTDAKSFAQLGMRCFGFAPLKLPPELDFSGMFHGVDERVPVDGLQFGVRVLDRFLDHA